MKALPDIPGSTDDSNCPMDMGLERDGYRSRNSRRDQSSTYTRAVVVACAVSVVFSAAISLSLITFGKDRLLQWFGVQADIKPWDVNAQTIQSVKLNIARVDDELQALRGNQSDMHTAVEDLSQRVKNLLEGVENSTAELDTFKADVVAQLTKLRADAAATKSTAPTPARARTHQNAVSVSVVPVALVSVRNSGGIPLVALREGMTSSPLLMPGDSWNGWMLIDADPADRSATFSVADQIRELRL